MTFSQSYHGLGSKIAVSAGDYVAFASTKLVCCLIKSLYGLKQAPKDGLASSFIICWMMAILC